MSTPRKIYPAGGVIADVGETVGAVLLLVRGTAKAQPRGFAQTFLLGPGAVLGLHDLVFGRDEPVFHSRVTAVDEVELCLLDIREIGEEYRRLPEHVQAIFKSVYVGGTAFLQAYDDASGKHLSELRGLADQIEALLAAEGRDGA